MSAEIEDSQRDNFEINSNHKLSLDQTNENMSKAAQKTVGKELFQYVNMNSSLVNLLTSDQQLIDRMKGNIDYTVSAQDKREKLLFAIVNNVHYLQELSKKNLQKMRKAEAKLREVQAENDALQKMNGKLLQEWEELKKYKEDYGKAQQEITQMLFASKEYKETIERFEKE